jgi:hydroxyacylglutathione hydrolase
MSQIIYRDPYVTVFQSVLYQTNSIVVRMEEAIVVIDPGCLPHEVMAIKSYVDTIREQRLLYLVFTHSDYDHIIGFGAFEPDKVFMSKVMDEGVDKEKALQTCLDFDQKHYLQRPYAIKYPVGDFLVYRDGAQFRQGSARMSFYNAPGHTADGIVLIIWHLGLCLSGDYLSDIEFPFIGHSSSDYIETLDKLIKVHDKNWFTRLIPGHGSPALSISDWLRRRTESLAYIYALRETIATGVVFDEKSLWTKYKYPLSQQQRHLDNIALMTREFEEGSWIWNPEEAQNALRDRRHETGGGLVFGEEAEE